MKKYLLTGLFLVTFFLWSATSASALEGGAVKVGLRFGDDAMFSANLENAEGNGYEFGFFDDQRRFRYLGWTEETAISMTAAGDIAVNSDGSYSVGDGGSRGIIGKYHVQLDEYFDDFDRAARVAEDYDGGYPAYISDEFVVRIGSYADERSARDTLDRLGTDGTVVSGSGTGVVVSVTRTDRVVFEFDCQGAESLGVLPDGRMDAVTWFKGYKYNGGFQYDRVTGGNLNVVNVVDLEDYVKGVLPHEMGGDWPEEALKAQAVCARTYALRTSKHRSLYGFDVCNTTDCQVYNGRSGASDATDRAVDATEGECLYADGKPIEALYFSSDGGATENAENVFNEPVSYLVGKMDPYEASISIPNYAYTVTYTPAQLTWVLQNSGYSIGNIRNVYVSEFTQLGNVRSVTFEDTAGKSLTLKGDKARFAFYSTTYQKNVKSMRFTINGAPSGVPDSGGQASLCVNSAANPVSSLKGLSAVSGGGKVSDISGAPAYAVTSSGVVSVGGSGGTRAARPSSGNGGNGEIVITGTGSGHNVGMSQYGANAMAKQGFRYEEILQFYYTGVTLR